MSVEEIKQEGLELTAAERRELAYFFLETLIHIEEEESTDELSPEWQEEVKKRWQEFEEGKVIPIDGLEMEKRLAEKYGVEL